MKYGELTLGQIEAIVNKLGGADGARALLRGELAVIRSIPSVSVPESFCLTVDYKRTLSEMIFHGHYDSVDSNITSERFRGRSYGNELHAELVHFGRSISSADAVSALILSGLRPATIAELLAFGEVNMFEQLKFPIVALGLPAERYGDSGVPFLGSVANSMRCLSLDHRVGNWSNNCRFLGVRN